MSWAPLDLRTVSDEPPEPPELGGLVYRGRRHWWSGPPESAKTLVAYAVALEAIRAGWRVALVDFEMGERDAKARLRDLGATDDNLERFDYYAPDAKPKLADLDAIAERAQLVIVDAAAGAFDLSGLDENREAEKFNTTWVRPLWNAGATTVVLDHVVKNAEARGMFASGHHRKIGGTEVHLGFHATTPLRRGHSGYVTVTAHKDRPGFHRKTVGTIELHSDPETHAITWAWKATPASVHEADGWRPTVLMERVSRYLETYPEGATRQAVKTAGLGNTKYVLEALNFLISDGYAEQPDTGRRGAPVRSVRPFRHEPDGAGTFPNVPDLGTRPNGASVPEAFPSGDRPQILLSPAKARNHA
jgi:hypothetical protein